MGTVISKAANGVGAVLGNAFTAPIKTIFSISCEGVCSGTWDILCFIEHLCMSDIVKLLMVLVLTYITLLFFYLLFKVGIIQCIGRNLCKMSWAACQAYWSALEGISCFLWHKLKNTKRVYRRHLYDIEEGYSSSVDGYSDEFGSSRVMRGRESVRERRKNRMRRSLYPKRKRWKSRRYGSSSHHHVRLKTNEVSLHLGHSKRLHNSRRLQTRGIIKRNRDLFKRQRFR
uniref:Protein HAPLESS 2 n=1 Tax=Anthurium amnicola TaxID=1678845 RepID=A0A1D1XMM5_9ARAE